MSSRTLPETELGYRLYRARGILGKSSPENNADNWMGRISDSTPLSKISIPGTHDAAAWNYAGEDSHFWNCQNVPLLTQLDLGIRALDLRFGWDEDHAKLLFFHSVACLDREAQLEDVLWVLFDWLNKHPTETLVVSLKRDDAPNIHDEAIQTKILDIMDGEQTKDYWFQKPDVIPTLGEVRGKIVLLNRMVFKNEKRGIKLSSGWGRNIRYIEVDFNTDSKPPQKALIEDYFLMEGHPGDANYQINDKKEATLSHLKKAKAGAPNELWITFSSAVGDKTASSLEDVTPEVMATGRDGIDGINQHLMKWCKEENENERGTGAGIIMMDFVASGLIESFIPPKSSSP